MFILFEQQQQQQLQLQVQLQQQVFFCVFFDGGERKTIRRTRQVSLLLTLRFLCFSAAAAAADKFQWPEVGGRLGRE